MEETPKYKQALEAIRAIWLDRSVPEEDTLELLENLRDEAEMMALACREDLDAGWDAE